MGKQPRIHLVAIDLDGTLLTSDNMVSPATMAIVETLKGRKTVHVVLATARPPRSTHRFYEQLQLDTPMINYNGALVHDPPSQRVLLHKPLGAELARGIAEMARGDYPDVLVSAEVLDRWYTDRLDESYVTQTGLLFKPNVVAPMEEWLDQPVTKLLLLGDGDRISELGRRIATKFRYDVQVSQTDRELLQIAHPTASKAEALKTVAGEFGVTREQVMAIGDNANDVDMLRWAGIGVAMANAPEEVLAVADYVTDHNDADGVAKAINMLIMGGRTDLPKAEA